MVYKFHIAIFVYKIHKMCASRQLCNRISYIGKKIFILNQGPGLWVQISYQPQMISIYAFIHSFTIYIDKHEWR